MIVKLGSFGLLLVALIAASTFVRAQATRDTSTIVSDAWITTQIYAKFFASSDIKARNINVDTSSGVVTLTGEVHSASERNQAVAKAKATDGVKQVIDKLTVTQAARPGRSSGRDTAAPRPNRADDVKAHAKSAADRVGKEISDTWITTKVQAMYFLDRDIKGMQIDVTTKDGVVTLAGAVVSEATHQKAIADARSIEGVRQVVDKLTVHR
jgi:hyperosmotically inducible periplasmic protein